jgi:hypothetical protein
MSTARRAASLTTTPDHNEDGQQPTKEDRREVETQASDGNRQRERTLPAGGKAHCPDSSRVGCVARYREQRHYLTVTRVCWFEMVTAQVGSSFPNLGRCSTDEYRHPAVVRGRLAQRMLSHAVATAVPDDISVPQTRPPTTALPWILVCQ